MKMGMSKRQGLQHAGKKRSLWHFLFRWTAAAVSTLLIWCGYVFITINQYGDSDGVMKADAGIVLGAALWNDRPSPALRERLELAYELLHDGSVDKLILSGGLGGLDSTLTEAEGMRDYLLAKGVSPDKLLLEEQASNTYENLLFSREIARQQQLSRLVIITHDYHAARALDIAGYIGYDSPQLYTGNSAVLNPYYNKGREVLAYTKWQLDKALDWSGLRPL